jgi:FKBP-type peptidyl-prolyl cis-trans isomerase
MDLVPGNKSDMKSGNHYIVLTFTTIILIFFCLNSCKDRSEKNTVQPPDRKEMAELNEYFVQKDRERIQNYIERKNLKMTESPTGLWYSVRNGGSGEFIKLNDRIVMQYDCSLLDGTKCYSSEELGPKEIILGKTGIEPGLLEGLLLLTRGGEATFILPPFLAYGLPGDGKKIPPRATVIYNVKILSKN